MMAKCCWIVSRAPEFSRLSHFPKTFSQQQQQQLRSGLWGWHSDQPFSLSILPNLANNLVAAAFQIEIKQASQTKIRRKRKKKTSAPFTQVSLSSRLPESQLKSLKCKVLLLLLLLLFLPNYFSPHPGLRDIQVSRTTLTLAFPLERSPGTNLDLYDVLSLVVKENSFLLVKVKPRDPNPQTTLPLSPQTLMIYYLRFSSTQPTFFLFLVYSALFNSSLFFACKKVISPFPCLLSSALKLLSTTAAANFCSRSNCTASVIIYWRAHCTGAQCTVHFFCLFHSSFSSSVCSNNFIDKSNRGNTKMSVH